MAFVSFTDSILLKIHQIKTSTFYSGHSQRDEFLCGRILCEVLTKVALMLDNLRM